MAPLNPQKKRRSGIHCHITKGGGRTVPDPVFRAGLRSEKDPSIHQTEEVPREKREQKNDLPEKGTKLNTPPRLPTKNRRKNGEGRKHR